jgi:hypothetical protein
MKLFTVLSSPVSPSFYVLCWIRQPKFQPSAIAWNINEVTPRIRILLEKLIVTQLVKKFPAVYGTRRFITVFTTACNTEALFEISWEPGVISPLVQLPSWRTTLCWLYATAYLIYSQLLTSM